MSHQRASKYMSLLLRHNPGAGGLTLDAGGWVAVARLLGALNKKGHAISFAGLKAIVEENDKQRFAFSQDGTMIRASQGHSIAVDLGLVAQCPPATLFHGTSTSVLDAIRASGILKQKRQYVHLSATEETAFTVGRRHGHAIVLTVDTAKVLATGRKFYLADNGVWLVDHVPQTCIDWKKIIYDLSSNSDK